MSKRLGILNPGDFFGEGSLAGQPVRMGAASAMSDCELMRIKKKAMMLATSPGTYIVRLVYGIFVGAEHPIRYEEDLVDQLFNPSEKRLARVLLLLARFGKDGKPESVVPQIQSGNARGDGGHNASRGSFFMNRFRKLGFIHYNGGLEVPASLLNVVLHD